MSTEDGGAGRGEQALLGGRYRLVRLLGRGGMAAVHEAVDEATGKRVAVKRLHDARAGDPHNTRLFELEFHTLAQLAHPRIVAVHDYHRVEDGAFYTMELLDGGDLSGRHLPWKQVCALLCDVCSALSLLHSRRLVHRDVTPGNVRCTQDGKAKLIDFGAMVPFGSHARTVGTPSFIAPEAITSQPLDGRADLYALGATAYYLLTGRHAYPARAFANLRNSWRTQPALPSRYAPDVPPALDQLVMSLLSLAPSRRPASAGAVIERLTAIAGIEPGEQLAVQRAFLTTPSLVGRDRIVPRIRKHMMRAAHGRGGSVFITGPRGVGRTRMVDLCVLEARLASGLVLRADGDDGRSEPFGAARALLEQLSTELPDKLGELLEPYAAALAPLWPEAARRVPGGAEAALDPQVQRPVLQQAMLGLLLDVSGHALLVVASDDVDRIDEPTRALLALLADRAPERRIAVVTAAEREAAAADVQGLSLLRQGLSVELQPLSLADTERLLISIFGDVPNVRMLASRLHEVSFGLPAETMQLAQHLLDRDLIRYRAGGWLLPSTIEHGALPDDVASALRARLSRLDDGARALAQAIALSGMPALTLDDCCHLLSQSDVSHVLRHVDALVTAQVLHAIEGGYALAQRRWASLLLADLPQGRKRALHARIADLLITRPRAEYQAAAHLLAAGEPDRAIDLLLERRRDAVRELSDHPARLADQIRALPPDWRDTLQAAADAATRLGRPRMHRFALRQTLLMYSVVGGDLPRELAREVVEQLHGDSGLRDYEALDESLPAAERLTRALAAAQARHDATPEHERGFSPWQAIAALVQATAHVNVLTGVSGDIAFLSALPSLWPLAALSPPIGLVQLNVETTCHLFAGRLVQARDGFLEIMARMTAVSGDLSPSALRYGELAIQYTTAAVEIYAGLPSADDRLELLERDPLFEVTAWRLRMLQALRRGDQRAAAQCERKAERLRIRDASPQFFDGCDIWIEIIAYAEIGDVAGLHHTLERIDAMATRYPVWEIAVDLARGQIELLRGEAQAAAATFERALDKRGAGTTVMWSAIARGLLTALTECGRIDEARTRGPVLLEQALAADLTLQIADLHFAMAAVQLAAGDCDAAQRQLAEIASIRRQWPLSDVFAGACHELAAKIALARKDRASFLAQAEACARPFVSSRHPILIARHERLLQDAQRAGLIASAPPRRAGAAERAEITTAATVDEGGRAVARAIARCRSKEERAARALSIALAGRAHRPCGMLYLLQNGTLRLVHESGVCPEPSHMEPLVVEFLRGEIEGSAAVDADDLVSSTVDDADWIGPAGTRFAPVLLSHPADGALAITGVLVYDTDAHRPPRESVLATVSAALSTAGDVLPVRIEPADRS